MNLFRRAYLNLLRNKGKTILLFAIIFLLGLALSISFSANQAITITQTNLMAQMPAITSLMLNEQSIVQDDYSIPTSLNREQITYELIAEIGALPYVQAFDFVLSASMLSFDLYRAHPEVDVELLPQWIRDELPYFQMGVRDQGGQLEPFHISGVSNPNMTDIEAGFLTLADGRTFTQAEIDEARPVIMIPQTLAIQNNLTVGSILTFKNKVHDEHALLAETDGNFILHWHLDEFIFASETYELEIIGIFNVEHLFDHSLDLIWQELELHNRIYAPSSLLECPILFRIDIILNNEVTLSGIDQHDVAPEEIIWIDAFFLLHDPRDAEVFIRTANDMLPEHWEIRDFSGIHASMTASLAHLDTVSEGVLIGTIIVGILVLTLVIILFLSDRKHEIGIYLALGERKQKIITQIILEVTAIFIVAMICSFLIGIMVSNTMSRSLVEQNLAHQMTIREEDPFAFVDMHIPWNLQFFHPGVLSFDEMIATFDTSLSVSTMLLFFAVGSTVTLASIIIPIIHLIRLEPKEILTFNHGN